MGTLLARCGFAPPEKKIRQIGRLEDCSMRSMRLLLLSGIGWDGVVWVWVWYRTNSKNEFLGSLAASGWMGNNVASSA